MRSLASHAALLVGILILSTFSNGCSSLKTPTAAIQAMNVKDIDAQGFTMAFDLNVTNPNAIALPIAASSYKIDLGGVNVMEGKGIPAVTLPANGSAPVTVPVKLTYDNLLAAGKAIANGGGKIPYAFSGSLAAGEADSGGGGGGALVNNLMGKTVSIPLKYEGTLDVMKIVQDPQIMMQSPAARKLAGSLVGSMLKQ